MEIWANATANNIIRTGRAGRPKGLPKTGGRQKGTRNRVTRQIAKVAQVHGRQMIDELVEMSRNEEIAADIRLKAKEVVLSYGYEIGRASL